MGTRKPRSTTAALVKGRSSVADDEHPDRLPIEETWPPEHLREQDDSVRGYNVNEIPSESAAHPDNMSQDDGTEPFGTVSETLESLREEAPRELGLSTAGPFIAPAASLIPELTPEQRKEAEATLNKRFEAFSEALYKACYTHGFLIYPQAAQDMGPERSRLKRSRRVATALASMVCVLATPEPKR